jgi:hypothetical protein
MMADREVDAVLAVLVAGWPGVAWSEATLALWSDEVRRFDFPAAREAARNCARHCRFVPSLAEYLDEATVAQRRHVEATAAVDRTALVSGERVASKEFAAEWIARRREQLANAKGPLAAGLAGVVNKAGRTVPPPPPTPRYDRTYFERGHDVMPKEPEPEAEP